MTESKAYWYNFKTESYDFCEGPQEDSEVADYIPQDQAAIGLYKIYRSSGLDMNESMANVFSACLGQIPPFALPTREA